jgi:purine-nucleoside phosphorylase
MSIHIGAKNGQIAETILLPGDPMRAKFIAENLLTDAECFNEVRGMLGFTGLWEDKRVSVMGTGMGMPSHAIYVHELIHEYGVKNLIRVGTCGALQKDLKIGDIILPLTASTDSNINHEVFKDCDFAPPANFDLLIHAFEAARQKGANVKVGGILSSDIFYNQNPQWIKPWVEHGTLAVEMETSALYSLAARSKTNALSILTVSDSLITGAVASSEQREKGFPLMAEMALSIAP